MAKSETVFADYLFICEEAQRKLREQLDKQLKPVVKREALKLQINVINTQWGLSSTDLPFDEQYENDAHGGFGDFLATLSGTYGIEFYFEVKNGEFKWL